MSKIIFAGTPDFAAVHLKALIDAEIIPCAVYTQPDRPAGRGHKLTPSPVKELALLHNIEVLTPENFKNKEAAHGSCVSFSSYKKTFKRLLPLRKFVDIDSNTAFEVGCLVLVDYTDLGELVDHSIYLRGACLCFALVCSVPQGADRVPCSLCIILIMQSASFALASTLVC